MSELRKRLRKPGFVQVWNDVANDERLTYRDLGLLTYMLSRPPGWRFSSERLASESREGRDAVRTSLKRLKAAGYYRTTKVRRDGHWETDAEVSDESVPEWLEP